MVAGRIGRDVRLKLNRRSFGVRDDSETGGIGAKGTEKIGAQKKEPKKKERRIREKGEQNERHRNNWKRAEKRREKKIVICGRRGRLYRGISKKRQTVKRLGEWNLKRLGGQDTWDQGTAKRRNNKKTRKKENREKWTKKEKTKNKRQIWKIQIVLCGRNGNRDRGGYPES